LLRGQQLLPIDLVERRPPRPDRSRRTPPAAPRSISSNAARRTLADLLDG
jgi:hypothetical protein